MLDSEEIPLDTDPLSPDTDDDGIPDGWEVLNSLDPLKNDSTEDPDGDSLTNLEEYNYGTDPHDPDTDDDDWSDGKEVECGTDPLDPNSKPQNTTAWFLLILIIIGFSIVAMFIVHRKYYKYPSSNIDSIT